VLTELIRPITTYRGQGLKKTGAKPNRHGIAYQWNKRVPRLLRGEPELGFNPLPINIFERGERLAPESRINYSKLTTVQHNTRVFIIGEVVDESLQRLTEAVDWCWAQMSHPTA
jgi:hypothetical protein